MRIESLMAPRPTSGNRYQHGMPRRVLDPSIMSSTTSRYACNCRGNKGCNVTFRSCE